MQIKICANDKYMPVYQNPGDAGADLRCAEEYEVSISPGNNQLIKTGVKVELPDHIMASIHPRSGLAKKGIVAITGIIDCGFRGEIKVNLINHSNQEVTISPGDRIAQLVFNPLVRPEFQQVDDISNSARGECGFGSTGIK